MSKNNSEKPGEVVGEVVEMSKEPIRITMELFSDGSIELTGPFHQPVMFIGALEMAKQLVYNKTTAAKQPQNIVVPERFKGPM